MEIGLIIVAVFTLVLLVRLVAGSMDGGRVEEYLREQGHELLDKS